MHQDGTKHFHSSEEKCEDPFSFTLYGEKNGNLFFPPWDLSIDAIYRV